MAKNTGNGHRVGAVRNRSQFERNGMFYKRGAGGLIMGGKADGTPFKGVRREK